MGESIKLIANNKKAYHDYFIEDNYEAGISLHGTEVKSLRMGKCSIKESFIRIENGEVIIYGMHVSPYEKGNISIKIRFVRANCCCTVQRSTSWSERLQRRAIRLFRCVSISRVALQRWRSASQKVRSSMTSVRISQSVISVAR